MNNEEKWHREQELSASDYDKGYADYMSNDHIGSLNESPSYRQGVEDARRDRLAGEVFSRIVQE